MQKFILFFIQSILFISFGAFLINAYMLQKNYFANKNSFNQINQTEEIITDKSSLYTEYSKSSYDNAILKNRITVLFFTSNWCTECLNQNEVNKKVFNNLNNENVVGLNIHILDSETTTETDAIAKKFDVTKENTTVILDKKGAISFKHVGDLTEEQLLLEINKVNKII